MVRTEYGKTAMFRQGDIWFPSSQTWVIPVIARDDASRLRAAQVVRDGSPWVFGMRHPEDVHALNEAQRGDWVVEMPDGHRRLLSPQEFEKTLGVDVAGMQKLAEDARYRSNLLRDLSEDREGDAARENAQASRLLASFSDACLDLAQRGDWRSEREDAQEIMDRRENVVDDARAREAMEAIQKAFSGESTLTVWITRSVRLEVPAEVVQSVMQAIAERGGKDGGPVSFESLGRHRDTALDALLRAGSEHTMGVPIEDSLSQQQWANRGVQASSRMVDLARELLAPQEMAAIRNAHPGEVLPFNQDGHFDDRLSSPESAERDRTLPRDAEDR